MFKILSVTWIPLDDTRPIAEDNTYSATVLFEDNDGNAKRYAAGYDWQETQDLMSKLGVSNPMTIKAIRMQGVLKNPEEPISASNPLLVTRQVELEGSRSLDVLQHLEESVLRDSIALAQGIADAIPDRTA